MDLEARLRHIKHIKSFGEEIGMEFKGVLSRYDATTKHQDLHYLIVTPPNSLELYVEEQVIGRSNRRLVKLEKEYREKGYDTMLSQAVGWDGCQITKALLRENYVEISGIVLHEGWHKTTRISDSNLDEAIASAVQYFGTVEYCRHYDKKNLEKAKKRLCETLETSDYITKYFRRLKKAYNQLNWIELKPQIIAEARLSKKNLFQEPKVNNSYFYFWYGYYQHFKLVGKTFKTLGLEESIKFFKRYEDHKNCIKNMREMTSAR
ncbi:MAG: hypothetical protein V1914_00730 [archaeon]